MRGAQNAERNYKNSLVRHADKVLERPNFGLLSCYSKMKQEKSLLLFLTRRFWELSDWQKRDQAYQEG